MMNKLRSSLDEGKVTFQNGDHIKGVWIAQTDETEENWGDFGRLYIFENDQISPQWDHISGDWCDFYTVERSNAQYTFRELTGV